MTLAGLILALAAQTGVGVSAALTEDEVRVTSRFAGAQLTVFGAAPFAEPTDDIVIVVRGPDRDAVVRRKRRVAGIWLNRDPVVFENAPGFYSVAATRPLGQIATFDALAQARIGAENLALTAKPQTGESVTVGPLGGALAPYRDALVRSKRAQALYSETPGAVTRFDGGLFRTVIALPARAPTGAYEAQVYLFREGAAVAQTTVQLDVVKAGLERLLYDAAHDHPWFYGVAVALGALLSGIGAGAAFTRR
ncbi:MAG: TIGR02186 family protein [Maricaulaceae bacterium]